MPYVYNLPQTVVSPMKNVSNVRVLFDGGNAHGAFSVARLQWNGDEVLGIRWNITENEAHDPQKISGAAVCVGEPNSRGYSTWFVLPDNFIEQLLGGTTLRDDIQAYLDAK